MWTLIILLGGLVVILAVAYFKPDWLKHVWETTLKDLWIVAVGVIMEAHQWLVSNPDWHAVIDPKYMPWALMGMGLLGIILRRMNIGEKSGEIVISRDDV